MQCLQGDAQAAKGSNSGNTQAEMKLGNTKIKPTSAQQLQPTLSGVQSNGGSKVSQPADNSVPRLINKSPRKQYKSSKIAIDHKEVRKGPGKRRLLEKEPQWIRKKQAKPKLKSPSKPCSNIAPKPKAKRAAKGSKLKKQPVASVSMPGENATREETTPKPQTSNVHGELPAENSRIGEMEHIASDVYEDHMYVPEWLRLDLQRIKREKLAISSDRVELGSSVALGQQVLFPLLQDLHVKSRGKTFTMGRGLHVGR